MSTQIQAFLATHFFIPICDRSPGKQFPNNSVSVSGFFRELKPDDGDGNENGKLQKKV